MKIFELGEGDGIRTHNACCQATVFQAAVFTGFTTPSP